MSGPVFIIISPIKDIPEWMTTTIAANMAGIFGFDTRVLPLVPDIGFAYDAVRKQYYSTRILEHLEKIAPKGCLKILAVTQEDLFVPILTHVYGEAQLGGCASIISTARLMDDGVGGESTMHTGQNRLVKEAAHELGHTFDLRHCNDPMCVMHYCRRLADVDRKSTRFCRYCNTLLTDAVKSMSG